jgi:probable rRNA maturation factor
MRKTGERPTFNVQRSKLYVGRRHFKMTFNAQHGEKFVPYLRKNLGRARAILGLHLCEVSIALVNDRKMSVLHEQFLGISGPTDVLTFPMELSEKGEAISGEVVICVPYARRAAKKYGVGVAQELLLYALHGMLHLAGFDDRTAAQYDRMHRAEDDILVRLGVGPVFDPIRSSGRRRGER